MKKIISKSIIYILIVLVLIQIIPFPINQQYETVEIRPHDDTYVEECTVNIKGRYYFRFLGNHIFKGKIIISKYPLTQGDMNDINTNFILNKKDPPMLYYTEQVYNRMDQDWEREYYILGNIITNLFFNKTVLVIGESKEYEKSEDRGYGVGGGWSSDGSYGYFIVPKAKTRDEAIKLMNKWKILN